MYDDAAAARYPTMTPLGTSPQDTYAQQPWPAPYPAPAWQTPHPMPAWQAPPGPYITIPQSPVPQFPPQNAHHLHSSLPWPPPDQPASWQIPPGATESGGGIEMSDWVKAFLIFGIAIAAMIMLKSILPEEVWNFLMEILPSEDD